MTYRMPGRPWFESLNKGLPARPLTWEGWVFTGAYVAGLASFAHAARVVPPYDEPPLIVPFVIAVLLLSGIYLMFSWLKSEDPGNPGRPSKAKAKLDLSGNDKPPPPSRWI
jgi:hypothetical protein